MTSLVLPAFGASLRLDLESVLSKSRDVCGVVVTYHPDADVIENLRRLVEQLDHIVVVDNGSSESELEPVRGLASSSGLALIENGDNLGIATGMNIGIRHAQALGCRWVLLFDQDSCVTDGFVDAMVSGFETLSAKVPLGILVPRYQDKRLGNAMEACRAPDGEIEAVNTSGSFMELRTFEQHGLLVDDFFIDGVDHELSLRLRAAGLRILECQEALLLHSPGTPAVHRLIRKKPIMTTNYSPMRRYYQERNKVWLARRYRRIFPGFIRGQMRVSLTEVVKVVLLEEDKVRKLSAFCRGWWDGLRGHLGKRY